MTDRMIDRMFEVSKVVAAQEAGLKRKVAALEDEVRYLRGVYADAGECFLEADAENKKLREAMTWIKNNSDNRSVHYRVAIEALGETK